MIYALFAGLSLALANNSVSIEKGEEAPFAGILITREKAIEILSTGFEDTLVTKHNLETQKEYCELNLKLRTDLSDAKISGLSKEVDYLESAIARRELFIEKGDRKIGKSANFVAGLLAGSVISIGVLWASNTVLTGGE